ncbi:hypothetical protein HanHA300_Chr04g0142341 [Helianthus annuus]|nr:hypothetical protein HanHA300_Chr04g0142341 [Helianthus annuus]KAJ0597515.1 hypothetical protein HanHA89_Chr04g0155491 [Helianthus annuus]KAJ0758164.1 hypothetical protein HanLR1_Chr04g0147231 [Helianthus annuus]KAJ0761820.1 hypothetical protein HanOQP8_Chr04g0154401 [Helianthus annuus]
MPSLQVSHPNEYTPFSAFQLPSTVNSKLFVSPARLKCNTGGETLTVIPIGGSTLAK